MLERLRQNVRVGRSMAASSSSPAIPNTFAGSNRAQVQNMAMIAVSLIVALTVGAIVAAFLLPVGLDELVAAETTNWSSGAQSMWDILDVIIILAVFLFFISVALGAASRF